MVRSPPPETGSPIRRQAFLGERDEQHNRRQARSDGTVAPGAHQSGQGAEPEFYCAAPDHDSDGNQDEPAPDFTAGNGFALRTSRGAQFATGSAGDAGG